MDKAAKRFFTARKAKGKNIFTLAQAAVTTFSALLNAQQLQLLNRKKTVVQLLILHSTFC